MSVLYFLVPIALLLAGSAAVAFRWAAHADQFEDLESPAVRLLEDFSAVDSTSRPDHAEKIAPREGR